MELPACRCSPTSLLDAASAKASPGAWEIIFVSWCRGVVVVEDFFNDSRLKSLAQKARNFFLCVLYRLCGKEFPEFRIPHTVSPQAGDFAFLEYSYEDRRSD